MSAERNLSGVASIAGSAPLLPTRDERRRRRRRAVARADFQTYGLAVRGLVAATAVFLLLPIVVIVYYSFQDNIYFEVLPRRFSLRWYIAAARNEDFVAAALMSLATAVIVTPVSIAAAVPTAYALVRFTFAGRGLLNLLIMSPILVPGVVTGIAFLTFFGVIGVDHGLVRNAVAMTCFTFPLAVRAIAANMHGIGPTWEEAALSLGASRRDVWLLVLLPLLRPGMLAAGIFAFVETIDNFSISVFLVSRETTTLPVEVYSYIRDFDDPSVAAVAMVSVAFSTLLMFVIERVIGLDRFLRQG
jgi:ABC-type spermidine/putrescine transport system permease subunit II